MAAENITKVMKAMGIYNVGGWGISAEIAAYGAGLQLIEENHGTGILVTIDYLDGITADEAERELRCYLPVHLPVTVEVQA